ncbi:hypothetical protein ABPG74_016349 [Tetrahymena malaccensis]
MVPMKNIKKLFSTKAKFSIFQHFSSTFYQQQNILSSFYIYFQYNCVCNLQHFNSSQSLFIDSEIDQRHKGVIQSLNVQLQKDKLNSLRQYRQYYFGLTTILYLQKLYLIILKQIIQVQKLLINLVYSFFHNLSQIEILNSIYFQTNLKCYSINIFYKNKIILSVNSIMYLL